MSKPISGSPYTQGLPHFANPQIWEEVTSPLFTMALSDEIEWEHNIGAEPQLVSVEYLCVEADQGYAVNDVIIPSLHSNTAARGIGVWKTYSVVGYMVSSSYVIAMHRPSGSNANLTLSKWRLRFRCFYLRTGDIITSLDTMGVVPLASGEVTNQADLKIKLSTFTGNPNLKFLKLYLMEYMPASTSDWHMRISIDGGATFKSGASDYKRTYSDTTQNTGSELRLDHGDVPKVASTDQGYAEILIPNASNCNEIMGMSWFYNSGNNFRVSKWGGRLNTFDGNYTDLQILAATGNISCKYLLHGIQGTT